MIAYSTVIVFFVFVFFEQKTIEIVIFKRINFKYLKNYGIFYYRKLKL